MFKAGQLVKIKSPESMGYLDGRCPPNWIQDMVHMANRVFEIYEVIDMRHSRGIVYLKIKDDTRSEIWAFEDSQVIPYNELSFKTIDK